ncbi:MAG: hypothetical protein FI699_08500 [SAR202 cluster bacterium]|nr:hypothetical protein [SAR202 cluster bacterium]
MSSISSVDEMFAWRSPSAKPYRALRGDISDDELVDIMLNEPKLIRRPILSDGVKIIFGYKKETYDQFI